MIDVSDRDSIITKLGLAPRLAHEALFGHRHSVASPPCHLEMIDFLHGDFDKGVLEGFRSSAKSTRAEEALVVKALYRRFHNGLVVGASFPRAKERLMAIKNELVTNDFITYLFGKQEGETWMEGKIVLANGTCLQAVGSGASLRGIRHLDYRPDWVLIDDLEDEESVRDPDQRAKTLIWLMGTLLPALSEQPPAKVRMLGNRLDDDAVLVRVAKDPAWRHLRIPIMEQHDKGSERYDLPPGKWRPLWPAMFPLEKIGQKRQEYERLGMLQTFNCEYMCEANDQGAKLFQKSHERTHAGVHTWQATFAAYDPARTVNASSAATGVAVFSWIRNKLVVWRGDARLWLPDEIINDIFETDLKYKPIEIGVEATGLEEFIMQPLRHRAVERRQLLPLRRLVPPRGKDSFIRGLQPFFKGGEIEFVDVSSEARGQLLSFPSGRKDFPNALAYALLMKPGLPVYPEFSMQNVVDGLPSSRDIWYLVTNATNHFTAGVLVQAVGGQVRVHADWIMEGPPGEVLDDLVGQARIFCGAEPKLRVPPVSDGIHDTVGLRVSARASQLSFEAGSDILKGRTAFRAMLSQLKRGEPLLVLNPVARWTLNGLSGGFARSLDKRGVVSDEPVDNAYRVLMEGLESFVGRYRGAGHDDAEDGVRYATTEAGRVYKTILPNQREPAPSKDEWYEFDRNDVRTSATIMPRR
jgi:hypothetical protein